MNNGTAIGSPAKKTQWSRKSSVAQIDDVVSHWLGTGMSRRRDSDDGRAGKKPHHEATSSCRALFLLDRLQVDLAFRWTDLRKCHVFSGGL
jgi:hypothetical protein